MNRDDAIELVYEAMDNRSDYDVTLRMYAEVAVDALAVSKKQTIKELRALFDDHYWDSLAHVKDIVMLHIDAVLARALLPKDGI